MSNNEKNGSPLSPGDDAEIKIERVVPEGMRSTFANHLVVHNSGHGEIHLSFFEINHPMIPGDPETITSKLRDIGSVRADCVARIVVSLQRMPSFIGAMARAYEASETGGEAEKGSDQKAQGKDQKHVG